MAGEPERVARDHFAALGRGDRRPARGSLAPELRGDARGRLERVA
jgi:hypothetical protein